MRDGLLTVDSAQGSWTSEVEAAIRALKDVDGVNIQSEGDDIREIHVLTSSNRPAKHIVRDVQTLLLTRFNRQIDHRVVSVAFSHPVAGAAPQRVQVPEPSPKSMRDERIRFVSANLYVSGPRVQAQVELKWKGVPRMGSASGHTTREGADPLIASATIAAVHGFLEDDVALSLDGLDFVRIGRRDVAVVGVELLAHRERKSLAGCCTIDQDRQQAVVLATLAAMNRVIGGLRTKEPTEYVLRPTSS